MRLVTSLLLFLLHALFAGDLLAQAQCPDIPARFTPEKSHKQILFDWKGTVLFDLGDQQVPVQVSLAMNRNGHDVKRIGDGLGSWEYTEIATHEDMRGNVHHTKRTLHTYEDTLQIAIEDATYDEHAQLVTIKVPHFSSQAAIRRGRLIFRASWNKSGHEKPFEVTPYDGYQMWAEYGDTSHYVLIDAPSKDVPLDAVLRVDAFDESGTPVACFTAHL